MRLHRQIAAAALAAIAMMGLAKPASSAVVDLVLADVTTRSFSAIWASDQAIDFALVRVFVDSVGSVDLSPMFAQSTPSASAIANGVASVRMSGLEPGVCVHVQTLTVAGGQVWLLPAAPPFPQVCARTAESKVGPGNGVIANDLVRHDLFAPDGASPGTGALLLVEIPSVSDRPVSALVGDGFAAPAAVTDLNNLFDASSGVSAEASADAIVVLTEFRGRLCPSFGDHRLTRFRRVPLHEEAPVVGQPLVELEAWVPCYFADTVCDDVVDILDAQRVLNQLKTSKGSCAFNSDLDVVADDVIDILDVQRVLNHLFETAPF